MVAVGNAHGLHGFWVGVAERRTIVKAGAGGMTAWQGRVKKERPVDAGRSS
jgi:hypothetical protein